MYIYRNDEAVKNVMIENPTYQNADTYQQIILIDDDRITNILSTRMLSKYAPDLSVQVF
ncbi:MAG: hypothetical protein RIR90_1089 [Bacteroidota bacterium]